MRIWLLATVLSIAAFTCLTPACARDNGKHDDTKSTETQQTTHAENNSAPSTPSAPPRVQSGANVALVGELLAAHGSPAPHGQEPIIEQHAPLPIHLPEPHPLPPAHPVIQQGPGADHPLFPHPPITNLGPPKLPHDPVAIDPHHGHHDEVVVEDHSCFHTDLVIVLESVHVEHPAVACHPLDPIAIAQRQGTYFSCREECLANFKAKFVGVFTNHFDSEPSAHPCYIPRQTVYNGHQLYVVYCPLYQSYGCWDPANANNWIPYNVWEDETMVDQLMLQQYYLYPTSAPFI